MRNLNTKIVILLTLSMLFLPLFALGNDSEQSKDSSESLSKENKTTIQAAANPETQEDKKENNNKNEEDEVRVFDAETEKILKMPMEDYIYGVIAAECPLLYHENALRAQIVAAHTYTRYLMNKNADSKYDVTTDYTVCQAYISREKALKNWGENAEIYDDKLKKLLNECLGLVITYDGKPIFAAYHAISSGKTENAENVWGNEVAYLKSVESVGDKLAKDYLTELSVSFTDADAKLSPLGITAEGLSKAKFQKTESGNVLSITLEGKSISVGEFTKALGLRSQNFDMKTGEEKLVFTVRGYGHQVGMSQNGANYMAKNGSDFKEILKHYYKGVEITKLK